MFSFEALSSTISSIDEIFAKKIAPQDPIRAHQVALLMAASRLGHLCIPCDPCMEGAEFIIKDPQDEFPKEPLCASSGLLYLQRNWVYESQIVHHVKRILHGTPSNVFPFLKVPGLLEDQQKAVELISQSSLTLISGGPGTGKSHLISQLIQAVDNRCEILVAAPTGRAAAQIAERLLGFSCTCATLHSTLGSREENPLNADLIIVDECSMIDVAMFARLLSRIPEGARLVLVGDSEQLPPVGSGSIFADLVDLEMLPMVRLRHCMRSEEHDVLALAGAIRSGDAEAVLARIQPIDSFSIITSRHPAPCEKEPDIQEALARLRNMCILSCVRSGPMGVDTCNLKVASMMKQRAGSSLFWTAPIVIVRNAASLYNGDLGVLMHKGEEALYAYFQSRNERVEVSQLPPFEYAYSLSVHKSQGCEYDDVFLLIPPGSEVFGKEVLYTAATRAKKTIYIDGDKQTIAKALTLSSRRSSGITGERMRKIFGVLCVFMCVSGYGEISSIESYDIEEKKLNSVGFYEIEPTFIITNQEDNLPDKGIPFGKSVEMIP